MSFKGDVGQISLLNIYQALNLNQQGGILVINSGRLKRRIRFVPEGIRLLSNSPGDHEPLKQILVKLKILTESQFQNAVGTKNDSELSIGDFLIQRRLLDPDLVTTEIAKHALELVYETFFWTPAEYEFNVSGEGDEFELFDPATYGKHLTNRVESVLMEVARREDEWKRIHEAITREKEIFIPTDPASFHKSRRSASELSGSSVAEIKKLIDGQRTVETITGEITLSKYETYRAIAVMLFEGEVRPLTTDEKKNIAGKLRKKFKVREVIDIYDQLLQEDPEDLDTRKNLVAILEKKKDFEDQLVDHYRFLANHYTNIGDVSETRGYLDKILAIEPHDLDAHDRIFDVHLHTRKRREALAEARNLVEAVKFRKAYARGAELLEKILGVFPNETSFYHDCADFHQFNGNPDKAIKNLKLVAVIYENREDFARLRKSYERIASIDPSEAQTLRRYQELERSVRRPFYRKFVPATVSGVVACSVFLLVYWVLLDFMCRQAYATINPEIDTLVENGDFEEATLVLNSLQRIYPLSSMRWNIATKIQVISERRREVDRSRKIQSEKKNTKFTSYLAHVTTLIRDQKYTAAWNEIKAFDTTGLNAANRQKLEQIESAVGEVISASDAILKDAEALSRRGKHKEAHARFIEILMKFPYTPAAKGLQIPLIIRTAPPGSRVNFNSRPVGLTPLRLRYNPFRRFHLQIQKRGFEDYSCGSETKEEQCVEFSREWSLTVPLKRIPLWTLTSDDLAATTPSFDSTRVFVPTKKGGVLCVERATGKALWNAVSRSNWPIRDRIKIWKNTLFFGTTDGSFVILDRTDGSDLLKLSLLTRDYSNPVVSSGPTPSGTVCIINGETLRGLHLGRRRTLWTTVGKNLLEQPPVPHREGFLLCTSRGEVLLLDGNTGAVTKSFQLNTRITTMGVVRDDSFYVADARGMIYSLDLESGTTAWSYRCERTDLSVPVAGSDQIMVGSASGYLLGLDRRTGNRKWDFSINDRFVAHGAMVGKKYVVGTSKGLLLCLDPQTGNFYWKLTADGSLRQPPAAGEDTVYVTSDSGTLYAFTFD